MNIFETIEKEPEKNINLFSYWYPKIKKSNFNIPESFIVNVPRNIQELLYAYSDEDFEIIFNWMKSNIKEMEKQNFNHQLVFVKTGLFSNKFNAKDCMTFNTAAHLSMSLMNIGYAAACVGCHEGNEELIIRERIFQEQNNIPTIYNGLPLNVEFRVFYDFDKQEVIHIHDYWDYDYVYESLSYNDKIIFEKTRIKREKQFKEKLSYIKSMIEQTLQYNQEFKGEWSIDIMYVEQENKFYMIDMAEAKKSTYYNKIKIL